jgi:hypothetical protein
MRTTLALLAALVVAVALFVACRARDDSPGDSVTDDSARADGSATDSGVPASDTPARPQPTVGKRPRTWHGFKLPEEMPVRVPLETLGRIEQIPDSVTKRDPTQPPKPDR